MNDIPLHIEECYILIDESLYKQIMSNAQDFELKIVRRKRKYNLYDIYKSRNVRLNSLDCVSTTVR